VLTTGSASALFRGDLVRRPIAGRSLSDRLRGVGLRTYTPGVDSPPERPAQFRNDLDALYELVGDLQVTVRGIASTQRQHGVRLIELGSAVGELGSAVGGLGTAVGELGSAVGGLGTGVGELRVDVDELRAGQTELRSEVDELRTGQIELRSEVGELHGGINELRGGQDEILRLLRARP
jgi:hypothetical protein